MAAPNTPRAKTERLMNLTMCLLSTRRALPKARIRRMVEAYHGVESDEAFDRMFERDKDELRGLGIPLVTENIGGAFEDEPGYRIDQRDYALPQIELTTDELAVVGLATRMWSHAAMAPNAATAWRKLASEGTEDDGGPDPFVGIEPSLGGSEPAFAPLQEAATRGRSVRFGYLGAGAGEATERHVDPWALTSWRGRWYLAGHDHDRDAPRVFRLSRVVSDVRDVGAVAVPRPDDYDARRAVADLARTDQDSGTATLRVRTGAGHSLRSRATTAGPAATDEGWDELTLPFGSLRAMADELASYGPDIVVTDPPELVAEVRGRLEGVLASLGTAR